MKGGGPGEAAPPQAVFWEGQGVTVEAVERLLTQLSSRAEEAGEGRPIVRSRVLNLLVPVRGTASADRAAQAAARLALQHPSRTIILMGDPQAAGGMDARVLVHTEGRGAEERRVIFCEQLVLTVRGEAARHPASIVLPLLVPELPAVVWWPEEPPWDQTFDELLRACDRLVVDTDRFRGVAGLGRLASVGCALGDLTWERLAPWREELARSCDPPAARECLTQLSRVVIRMGTLPRAWLLAGWLADRLSWELLAHEPTPGGGTVRWRRPGGELSMELAVDRSKEETVELSAPQATFRVQGKAGEGTAFIRFPGEPGMERRLRWEERTPPMCLDRVLARGSDRSLRNALTHAARLVGEANDRKEKGGAGAK